jgi:Polysulphide reductase, NrfD
MSEMGRTDGNSGGNPAAGREARLQQIRRDAELQARRREFAVTARPPILPKASPETGYYEQPLLKTPAWTWEIPIYFFTGGAAGVASALASVGKLTGADEDLIRDAQWLAAIGGAISPALLVADLGMPSRFINMLRVFKVQSPMSVGSWTLVAFSSSAAAAATLAELERRRPAMSIPILSETAQFVAALSGLVLSTYTGVLIGATAIPAWNQNVGLLPLHFVASGTSAAVSMLELRGHTSKSLNRLALGAAAVETVTGASMEMRKGPAMEPVHAEWTGWLMRTAGLLSGPIPLVLRILAGTTSRRARKAKLRRAAAISAVAGSMATRWAWVYAGRVSSKDPKVPLELPSPSRPKVEQLSKDK